MPVERFSYITFHNSLPGNRGNLVKKWKAVGLLQGEYCWVFTIPNMPIGIMVRSSIGVEQVSAETGEDSIRIIVVRIKNCHDSEDYTPIGKGVDTYTTRVKGWETRLEAKIREVAKRIGQITQPFDDSDSVFFVQKEGPNKGRPFANDKDGKFRWLDKSQ